MIVNTKTHSYMDDFFKIILRQNWFCWDISTSSQVSNCNVVVLEIYLDHKFQRPQKSLNCKSLAWVVVTQTH